MLRPRLLTNLLAFTLLVGMSLALVIPAMAAETSNTAGQVLNGLQKTGTGAGFDLSGVKPKKDFVTAFLGFANALTILLATVFVFLVIYSGFLWMSARGNEQQVTKAKTIILGAAIGIIVVISARAIAELALEILSKTIITGPPV